MRRIFVSIFAIAALAVATAAVGAGMADWDYFKSDLVRCADATAVGHPACGSSSTGTDPLSSGRITLWERDVTLKLDGASPNTNYVLTFVPLHNTGADLTGPYTAGTTVQLGQFKTNNRGKAWPNFNRTSITGSTLGYFVVSRVGGLNQFVTGFDPSPRGPVPVSSTTPFPYPY